MSRSGYSDDLDKWALIRWRGAVASSIRGARGQAMLRDLLAALDALPEKRLGAESLVTADGEYCALGALGRARGIDMAEIDPDDRNQVATAFGISVALAAEIMYENDEDFRDKRVYKPFEICGPVRPDYPDWGRHEIMILVPDENGPEMRWNRMRSWVTANLREEA